MLVPNLFEFLSTDQLLVLHSCLFVVDGSVSVLLNLLVYLANVPDKFLIFDILFHNVLEFGTHEIFLNRTVVVLEWREAYSREVESSDNDFVLSLRYMFVSHFGSVIIIWMLNGFVKEKIVN